MTKKLGIITSGGGLKCSYGVGVMLALSERFGMREPHALISCSGSAGTGSYYVARQYDSIRNIWENLLSTKDFVNLARFWRIIDIDYLIDEVFKKQDPLDSKTIHSSPINYLIPALNRQTGEVDYFSNEGNIDVFEAMRATKAMPLAFRVSPRVEIGDSMYCDGPLSSSVDTHFEKAIELGAEKVLTVDHASPSLSRHFEHRMFSLWAFTQSSDFKAGYSSNRQRVEQYEVPGDIEVFRVRPQNPLEITTLNNDRRLLVKTIQQGYDETSANDELVKFLES
jgi:predicted patatin/cPLA2 family phospholipase